MDNRVAICLGGAEGVLDEFKQAVSLITGKERVVFACNDQIASFPEHINFACTLHPQKLPFWLSERKRLGLNVPRETWAHRPGEGVTHSTQDWSGSSGLFMVKIAIEKGFQKILLCGIPLVAERTHFVRRKKWDQATAFRRGWNTNYRSYARFTRSMSGWTAQKVGLPDKDWLEEWPPRPKFEREPLG